MNLARAYAATAAIRPPRDQEADVFRRVAGGLKAARENTQSLARVKALADARLLWSQTELLLRDPQNQLPADLRGALISVAMAVQRELATPDADVDFVIQCCEDVIAGLSGRP